MRQAIETKYIGPTNTRGARIKASAVAGSITVQWDHSIDSGANHRQAAVALQKKFGWDVKNLLVGGSTPKGYVFVQVLRSHK